LAGAIAMQLGLHGLVLATTAACAAGNHALAIGYEWIRGGRAPVVLAGGAEGLSRLAHIGFSRLHVVASDLCRPFDRRRQGLLLGEGAAFLVLEDPVHARARGAHIWAGLAGYGLAGDAYHLVAPHPEGRGAALAMRRALHMAGIAPEDIDYINAHGTGTPQNDSAETSAIKSAFGRHAFQVPISSIKALGGHAMGAAAAIEAIACVLALQHQCIPPTHHLEEPDPLCDLDYVPQVPREARLRWVMNNSFAFGGNNAAVVLAHPDAV
jgi:3-oxoacyl-(acyl-carrier-protein) synthase